MQKIKEKKAKPTKSDDSLVHKDISVRLFFISFFFLFTTFWTQNKNRKVDAIRVSLYLRTANLVRLPPRRPAQHTKGWRQTLHYTKWKKQNQTKDRPKHRRKTQSYINSLNFLTEEMTSMSEGESQTILIKVFCIHTNNHANNWLGCLGLLWLFRIVRDFAYFYLSNHGCLYF